MEIGHKTSGNESPITGNIDSNIRESGNSIPQNNESSNAPKIKWVLTLCIAGCVVAVIVTFVFMLIFIITGVFAKMNNNLEVISTTAILVFIGVLATFVVVGNYSQVSDIQQRFMLENRKNNEMINDIIQDLKHKIDIDMRDLQKKYFEKLEIYKKEFELIHNLPPVYELIETIQGNLVKTWFVLAKSVPIQKEEKEKELDAFVRLFSERYRNDSRYNSILIFDNKDACAIRIKAASDVMSDDNYMLVAESLIGVKDHNKEGIRMYPWKEYDRYKELLLKRNI